MPYVRETSPDVFAEIDPSQTIVVRNNGRPDVQWPGSIVSVWSADDLAAIGIYRVEPAVCPAGRRVTRSHYARVAGVVTQVLDTAMTTGGGSPPILAAAAFNLIVRSADFSIESVEAAFNLAGVAYFDVGNYLAIFEDALADTAYAPLLIGSDNALMQVVDKAADSFLIESRNLSGDFADPQQFSIQVFRL
jgi:hypothetical protein